MQVIPQLLVQFDRLRAIFPQQISPPFGETQQLGAFAATGFPQVDPNTGLTYGANDGTQNGGASGGLEYDSLLKVLHRRSLFVPHDQNVSGGYGYGDTFNQDGNPTVTWFNFQETDGLDVSLINMTPQVVPPGFETIHVDYLGLPGHAVPPGKVGSFVMTGANGAGCQGFTALLSLGVPASVPVNGTCYASVRFRVTGSGNSPRWYAVSWQAGLGIQFGMTDVLDSNGLPLSFRYTDRIKTGDNLTALLSPFPAPPASAPSGGGPTPPSPDCYPIPLALGVKLMAGQLALTLGSQDTPFLWPHDVTASTNGTPDWLIDCFQIVGAAVQTLDWSIHPTKWLATAAYVSGQTNIGFAPDPGQFGTISYRVHCAPVSSALQQAQSAAAGNGYLSLVGFVPPGCSAASTTYDIQEGSLLRYIVAMSGTAISSYRGLAWSDYAEAVRAVTIDIPGTTLSVPSNLIVLGQSPSTPNPMEVGVTHTFDLDCLSIRSQASMTWNNYHGEWTNGSETGFLDATGLFAVSISMGIAGYSTIQQFTGAANTESTNLWQAGGDDRVTMTCDDLWLFLDVPIWNAPQVDGWNVYYFMAWCAEKGSLTRAQMAFSDFIPDDAYGPSPGLPLSSNYYLGTGPAGTVLSNFGGGQTLRSIMLSVSAKLGAMLYFDVFGLLHFEKFVLPTPGPNIPTFSHIDGDSLTGNTLSGIWSGRYHRSLRDVRNSVTVIGVSALAGGWIPIVSHAIDLDSVYNDTVGNYLGYFNPTVWSDNVFVDQGFADAAASEMLAYLSIPDKQVEFTTWYQGFPVYPTSLIRVITPRSGANGYVFYVTQTSVSFCKGQAPRLDITARLIPLPT